MKNQYDFFKSNREFAPGRISHGDSSSTGKRKIARPFKRNCATHLVLKSENAKGSLNMRTARNQIAIERIIARQAQRFGVKIHAEQNVGNHIHCIVSCGARENFKNFLRAVTGLIARFVLNGRGGKFWTQIPFTRLITGKRDYMAMLRYIAKNLIEATCGKSARTAIETEEVEARKERRRTLAKIRQQKSRS